MPLVRLNTLRAKSEKVVGSRGSLGGVGSSQGAFHFDGGALCYGLGPGSEPTQSRIGQTTK